MAPRNVVDGVVANHLCCGCGTCVAVCPADALFIAETPAGLAVVQERPEGACTECGLCLQVCPGVHLRADALDQIDDPFIGSVRAAYWGWASNAGTRRNGASGGVVTAMVRQLMLAGVVQAVLATRWSRDNPLEHEAFVAREPDELDQTQKSRYCPVALNARLGDLLQFESVAVVGLPCHLHGIANVVGQGVDVPDIISVGLFCERTLSTIVIDRLASAAVPEGGVEQFEYRHKGCTGWPGDVYVRSEQGETVFLDRTERMRLKEVHTPLRCRLCFDKFNVLADISCGDGYGAPHADEGVSALIVRTRRGEAVIAQAGRALALDEVAPDRLLRAHHVQQRQRDCVAFSAAYRKLFPDAPVPLPAEYRRIASAPHQRVVRGCLRTLEAGVRLESASDPARARRIARRMELRLRIEAILIKPRGLLARIVKWGLHALLGGSGLLRRRSGR